MIVYYNEIDPHAAAWLRSLIKAGLITDGIVDERSIREVEPHEVMGFDRVHFFAGIGGWDYALQLAGWPADRPVWTGSCPCQPFSSAGKQKGEKDERHLWPEFHRLIAECRPSVVFGEQVASKLGRKWLAGVRAEMEALGYAVGAADLCAAGVGSPHIRQRLWWVADSANADRRAGICGAEKGIRESEIGREQSGERGIDGRLAVPHVNGRDQAGERVAASGGDGVERDGSSGGDDASPWANAILIPCGDGKSRRIEPSSFPLAHGIPGRVAQLRGLGNAIVPQVAAEFIKACLET